MCSVVLNNLTEYMFFNTPAIFSGETADSTNIIEARSAEPSGTESESLSDVRSQRNT